MKQAAIFFVATLCLALAIFVVLIMAYQSVQRTPPVQYDRAVYTPERTDLCPGEMLVYTNTLTISRPSIVMSSLSWFRGRGAQARPITTIAEIPLPARVFAVPIVIGPNRRENRIPAGLPAGDYEFHFGATDTISAPAIHIVLFSVRAGC